MAHPQSNSYFSHVITFLSISLFLFHGIDFFLNFSIIKGLRVALQISSNPKWCSLIWTTWLSIHLSQLSICRAWILMATSEWEPKHKALLLHCTDCSLEHWSTTNFLQFQHHVFLPYSMVTKMKRSVLWTWWREAGTHRPPLALGEIHHFLHL